jgi:cytochrome d ubiquinol oxidase subunit II
VIPFLLGLALGDLLHGLLINSSHVYTGSFWTLLQPYGLYTGLTFVVTCLVLGAVFITLKTAGPIHERAFRWAEALGWVGFFVVWGFVIWTHVGQGKGFVPNVFEAIAFFGALGVPVLVRGRLEGLPFIFAAVAAGASVASIFGELYPNVMISSTRAANNLTITNAISPPYTLHVMSAVAAFFFPLVLIYQGWTYHVFKQRLRGPRVDPTVPGGSSPAAPPRAVPARQAQ